MRTSSLRSERRAKACQTYEHMHACNARLFQIGKFRSPSGRCAKASQTCESTCTPVMHAFSNEHMHANEAPRARQAESRCVCVYIYMYTYALTPRHLLHDRVIKLSRTRRLRQPAGPPERTRARRSAPGRMWRGIRRNHWLCGRMLLLQPGHVGAHQRRVIAGTLGVVQQAL